MKYLLFIYLLAISCNKSKDSTYQCTCDIYKIKHFTYMPNSPLSDVELYTNTSRSEAEDKMALFQIKYTDATKDTFASLKAAYPDAFISCGLKDIYE